MPAMTPRTIKRLLYLLIGFGLLVIFLNKIISSIKLEIISPLITNKVASQNLTDKTLGGAVLNSLDGAKGTYAIVVKNLKTGESFAVNEHMKFATGSLYKLWIMATSFDQIKNGTLSEDEELTADVSELNDKFDIDQDAAELSEGSINLTVKQALQQMITISHNYASLLLAERIKLSNVTKFLDAYGFSESAIGNPPQTTAFDLAIFMEKLYKNQLSDQEHTDQMIDLLKLQTLNDKLPKYLPGETVIAHKTGEIDYFTHDAGIVYLPAGDYIIVCLSQSDYPPGAEDRIGLISKNVYQYFQSKDI